MIFSSGDLAISAATIASMDRVGRGEQAAQREENSKRAYRFPRFIEFSNKSTPIICNVARVPA